MSARRIVVSSTALGAPRRVTVYVYETLDEMRAAARRFNGNDDPETIGVTHATQWVRDGSLRSVIVRVTRGHLGTQVVSHEIHHAATAWYGDYCARRIVTDAHLNHHNEPFAHLYSDLLAHLVDRLHEHGYYD